MIITAILYIIYLMLLVGTAPIRIFSDASLPTAITTSITTASGYMSALSDFVPITTILSLLGFSLLFETGYFVYKVAYWIIKKIPTIS